MTKRKAASTAPERPTNALRVGLWLRDITAARRGKVRVVCIEALLPVTGKRGEHPAATIVAHPSGVQSETRLESLANTTLYAALSPAEAHALLAQPQEPVVRSTANMSSVTLRVGQAQVPVLRALLEHFVKLQFLDSAMHVLSESERAVCSRLLDQLPRPEPTPP